MNARIKKTNERTTEANEDIGTARLVTRARREIAAGAPLISKSAVDLIAAEITAKDLK